MTELFKNSHDALTFAFNYSSQQYAQSPMSKMLRGPSSGTGKGLYALDGAGQAGFIMAEVGRLDPLQRACVIARHSPRFAQCQCCGSQDRMMLQEYREAVATLAQWAISAFTGVSLRNERELIIRSYYERGIKVQDIAEQTKVAKRTLYDHKTKIWEALWSLDNLALGAIDERLRKPEIPMLEPKKDTKKELKKKQKAA